MSYRFVRAEPPKFQLIAPNITSEAVQRDAVQHMSDAEVATAVAWDVLRTIHTKKLVACAKQILQKELTPAALPPLVLFTDRQGSARSAANGIAGKNVLGPSQQALKRLLPGTFYEDPVTGAFYVAGPPELFFPTLVLDTDGSFHRARPVVMGPTGDDYTLHANGFAERTLKGIFLRRAVGGADIPTYSDGQVVPAASATEDGLDVKAHIQGGLQVLVDERGRVVDYLEDAPARFVKEATPDPSGAVHMTVRSLDTLSEAVEKHLAVSPGAGQGSATRTGLRAIPLNKDQTWQIDELDRATASDNPEYVKGSKRATYATLTANQAFDQESSYGWLVRPALEPTPMAPFVRRNQLREKEAQVAAELAQSEAAANAGSAAGFGSGVAGGAGASASGSQQQARKGHIEGHMAPKVKQAPASRIKPQEFWKDKAKEQEKLKEKVKGSCRLCGEENLKDVWEHLCTDAHKLHGAPNAARLESVARAVNYSPPQPPTEDECLLTLRVAAQARVLNSEEGRQLHMLDGVFAARNIAANVVAVRKLKDSMKQMDKTGKEESYTGKYRGPKGLGCLRSTLPPYARVLLLDGNTGEVLACTANVTLTDIKQVQGKDLFLEYRSRQKNSADGAGSCSESGLPPVSAARCVLPCTDVRLLPGVRHPTFPSLCTLEVMPQGPFTSESLATAGVGAMLLDDSVSVVHQSYKLMSACALRCVWEDICQGANRQSETLERVITPSLWAMGSSATTSSTTEHPTPNDISLARAVVNMDTSSSAVCALLEAAGLQSCGELANEIKGFLQTLGVENVQAAVEAEAAVPRARPYPLVVGPSRINGKAVSALRHAAQQVMKCVTDQLSSAEGAGVGAGSDRPLRLDSDHLGDAVSTRSSGAAVSNNASPAVLLPAEPDLSKVARHSFDRTALALAPPHIRMSGSCLLLWLGLLEDEEPRNKAKVPIPTVHNWGVPELAPTLQPMYEAELEALAKLEEIEAEDLQQLENRYVRSKEWHKRKLKDEERAGRTAASGCASAPSSNGAGQPQDELMQEPAHTGAPLSANPNEPAPCTPVKVAYAVHSEEASTPAVLLPAQPQVHLAAAVASPDQRRSASAAALYCNMPPVALHALMPPSPALRVAASSPTEERGGAAVELGAQATPPVSQAQLFERISVAAVQSTVAQSSGHNAPCEPVAAAASAAAASTAPDVDEQVHTQAAAGSTQGELEAPTRDDRHSGLDTSEHVSPSNLPSAPAANELMQPGNGCLSTGGDRNRSPTKERGSSIKQQPSSEMTGVVVDDEQLCVKVNEPKKAADFPPRLLAAGCACAKEDEQGQQQADALTATVTRGLQLGSDTNHPTALLPAQLQGARDGRKQGTRGAAGRSAGKRMQAKGGQEHASTATQASQVADAPMSIGDGEERKQGFSTTAPVAASLASLRAGPAFTAQNMSTAVAAEQSSKLGVPADAVDTSAGAVGMIRQEADGTEARNSIAAGSSRRELNTGGEDSDEQRRTSQPTAVATPHASAAAGSMASEEDEVERRLREREQLSARGATASATFSNVTSDAPAIIADLQSKAKNVYSRTGKLKAAAGSPVQVEASPKHALVPVSGRDVASALRSVGQPAGSTGTGTGTGNDWMNVLSDASGAAGETVLRRQDGQAAFKPSDAAEHAGSGLSVSHTSGGAQADAGTPGAGGGRGRNAKGRCAPSNVPVAAAKARATAPVSASSFGGTSSSGAEPTGSLGDTHAHAGDMKTREPSEAVAGRKASRKQGQTQKVKRLTNTEKLMATGAAALACPDAGSATQTAAVSPAPSLRRRGQLSGTELGHASRGDQIGQQDKEADMLSIGDDGESAESTPAKRSRTAGNVFEEGFSPESAGRRGKAAAIRKPAVSSKKKETPTKSVRLASGGLPATRSAAVVPAPAIDAGTRRGGGSHSAASTAALSVKQTPSLAGLSKGEDGQSTGVSPGRKRAREEEDEFDYISEGEAATTGRTHGGAGRALLGTAPILSTILSGKVQKTVNRAALSDAPTPHGHGEAHIDAAALSATAQKLAGKRARYNSDAQDGSRNGLKKTEVDDTSPSKASRAGTPNRGGRKQMQAVAGPDELQAARRSLRLSPPDKKRKA